MFLAVFLFLPHMLQQFRESHSRQKLQTKAAGCRIEFPCAFPRESLLGQMESQIVQRLLQSFMPCLFSVSVTVKLKPEIISQGD